LFASSPQAAGDETHCDSIAYLRFLFYLTHDWDQPLLDDYPDL